MHRFAAAVANMPESLHDRHLIFEHELFVHPGRDGHGLLALGEAPQIPRARAAGVVLRRQLRGPSEPAGADVVALVIERIKSVLLQEAHHVHRPVAQESHQPADALGVVAQVHHELPQAAQLDQLARQSQRPIPARAHPRRKQVAESVPRQATSPSVAGRSTWIFWNLSVKGRRGPSAARSSGARRPARRR